MKIEVNEFERMTLRYMLFVVKKSIHQHGGETQSVVGGLSHDEVGVVYMLYYKLMPTSERRTSHEKTDHVEIESSIL